MLVGRGASASRERGSQGPNMVSIASMTRTSSKSSAGSRASTTSLSKAQAQARINAVTNRLMQPKAAAVESASTYEEITPVDTIGMLDLRSSSEKEKKRPTPLVRRSQPHLPGLQRTAEMQQVVSPLTKGSYSSSFSSVPTSSRKTAVDLDGRRAPRMVADCALSRAIYARARQYIAEHEDRGSGTPRGKRMLQALKYSTHAVMLQNRVVVHWVKEVMRHDDPAIDVRELRTLPKLMEARRRSSSTRDVAQRWADLLKEIEGIEETQADSMEQTIAALSERLKDEIGAAGVDVRKSIHTLTQGLKLAGHSFHNLALTYSQHLEGLEDLTCLIAQRKSEADELMRKYIQRTVRLKKQLRQVLKQHRAAAAEEGRPMSGMSPSNDPEMVFLEGLSSPGSESRAASPSLETPSTAVPLGVSGEADLELAQGTVERPDSQDNPVPLERLLLQCEADFCDKPLEKLEVIQSELELLVNSVDETSNPHDASESPLHGPGLSGGDEESVGDEEAKSPAAATRSAPLPGRPFHYHAPPVLDEDGGRGVSDNSIRSSSSSTAVPRDSAVVMGRSISNRSTSSVGLPWCIGGGGRGFYAKEEAPPSTAPSAMTAGDALDRMAHERSGRLDDPLMMVRPVLSAPGRGSLQQEKSGSPQRRERTRRVMMGASHSEPMLPALGHSPPLGGGRLSQAGRTALGKMTVQGTSVGAQA